jgi:uncharacterized protein YerC
MHTIAMQMVAEDVSVKKAFDSLRGRNFSKIQALDEISSALLAVLWENWNGKLPAPDFSDAKATAEWLKSSETRWSEVTRLIAEGQSYSDIWPDS